MEELSSPIQLYQEILGSSFEKIKKGLPKRYIGVKDFISQLQGLMMQDTQNKLDAGKYFIVYKLAINTKYQKLIEISLKSIQLLLSYNFLNGESQDYTLEVNLEEFKELHDPSTLKEVAGQRKLLDTIMETLYSLSSSGEKDDQIQILVIKIFAQLSTDIHCELHERHLLLTIQTIISFYSVTRNSQVEKAAKNVLQQIVNYNFQKLSYIDCKKIKLQLFGDGQMTNAYQQSRGRQQVGQTFDMSVLQKERSPSPNQMKQEKILKNDALQQNQLNQKELSPINNILKSQEDDQEMEKDENDNVDQFNKNKPTFETICFHALQNIVDDVCLYEARKTEITSQIKDNQNIAANLKSKYLNIELDNLPFRSVPHELDPNDSKFKRVIHLTREPVLNECGESAGLFGWCIKCRKTANFYCKDLRVPVCSYNCKIQYSSINDLVNKRYEDYKKNSKIAFEDCFIIISCLTHFLVAPPEERVKQSLGYNPSSVEGLKSVNRMKTVSLEMIYGIFDLRDLDFLKKDQVVKIIKDQLFDGLLKCCLNNEKSIFTLSFGIFLQLLIFHKEEYKSEVSIFINEIFLQLLESPNSSSNHRHLALQVLNKAFSKPRVVLDFYVNYDCSFNQVQLVDRIVSILSKISTGLYGGIEFQTVIQPSSELLLRQYSIETLALMMRSIYEYFDDYVKSTQEILNQPGIKTDVVPKNLDETTILSGGAEENREMIKIDINEHFSSQIHLKNQISLFQNLHRVEREHIIKIETQRAILKFNKKPSHGIKHLVQTGVLKADDAKGIAAFLRNNLSLSKDQIGEYIGGHQDININVLSEFTDKLDFKGYRLDESIRYYLEQFTLPGEAQIVDRILQKFGDKYESDNPNLFQSQGNAYTLSFLLIMLQTDMYNPQVKDKMKIEDFIKIAKGIEGENFENEYLTELYKSIQRMPLALHEKARQAKSLQDSISTTIRKKQDLFIEETRLMIEKSKQSLFSEKNKLASKFVKANSMYYIGPLIETIGPKILAAFKHGIEQCDDDKTVKFCLEGFSSSLMLSCHFNLQNERNNFLETLCAQSGLVQFPMGFKRKNYQAIKTILNLAAKIAGGLQDSWYHILKLVSQLNDLRLIQNSIEKRGGVQKKIGSLSGDQEWVGVQTIYFDNDLIDRIYGKTISLDGENILSFTKALCRVSKEELTTVGQSPRIFSLQKIAEIAELNIERVVIVWNRIWAIIRDHFAEVGCHNNSQIAIIAVDGLKQLSQKFFNREERFNLQFQRDFLRPFEIIFQNVPPQNHFIKDFILECLKSFILNYQKKMKSGWRIIFNIIGMALTDEKIQNVNNNPSFQDELGKTAFTMLTNIINKNLDSIHDVFVDLVQCLNKLSQKQQEDMAFASISFVKKCIYHLADKCQVMPKSKLSISTIQSNESQTSLNQDPNSVGPQSTNYKKSTENYWVPLLGVLSSLSGDSRPEIQEKSMETLFEILTEYGYTFSIEFWKMIFQGVLRPLFDEIQFTFQSKSHRLQQADSHKFNWLKLSCSKAFIHITNLLFDYYDELHSLVVEFFRTYENCINNTNESLIKQSITAAKNTLIQLGPKFNKEDWDMVVEFFDRMIRLTTPNKLLNLNVDEKGQKIVQDVKGSRLQSLATFHNQKFNFDDSNAQSKAQLLLIKVLQDVINQFQDKLVSEQLASFCKILDRSYRFAIEFNSQIFLRYCLWQSGFNSELKQLPGILRQERQAQAMSLYIQYALYRKQLKAGLNTDLNYLLDKLIEYMALFLKKHKDLPKILEAKKQTNKESFEKLDDEELDEDAIDQIVYKLKLTEVERDVNNHRTMMAETVLPILDKINLSQMKERVKEIYCILVDMTQFSQNKSFSQMGCQQCRNCRKCSGFDEDLDIFIRKIMKKYFKFICESQQPASSSNHLTSPQSSEQLPLKAQQEHIDFLDNSNKENVKSQFKNGQSIQSETQASEMNQVENNQTRNNTNHHLELHEEGIFQGQLMVKNTPERPHKNKKEANGEKENQDLEFEYDQIGTPLMIKGSSVLEEDDSIKKMRFREQNIDKESSEFYSDRRQGEEEQNKIVPNQ